MKKINTSKIIILYDTFIAHCIFLVPSNVTKYQIKNGHLWRKFFVLFFDYQLSLFAWRLSFDLHYSRLRGDLWTRRNSYCTKELGSWVGATLLTLLVCQSLPIQVIYKFKVKYNKYYSLCDMIMSTLMINVIYILS